MFMGFYEDTDSGALKVSVQVVQCRDSGASSPNIDIVCTLGSNDDTG